MKDTRKPKGAKVPARLRQRAEAIINNAKRYDASTRKAIRRALREQHADLADCVMRAQQGETINDLTAAQVEANATRAGLRDLPTLLAAVFAHPDLPERMWEFIADGLCELDNGFEKYENPEVMRAVLAGYKPRRQSMRKGGK